MFNKIKYYLAAFGAGIVAAFMAWVYYMRDGDGTPDLQDPFKPLVEANEEKLEELDVKIEDLKENGPAEMTDEEIVKYWEGE